MFCSVQLGKYFKVMVHLLNIRLLFNSFKQSLRQTLNCSCIQTVRHRCNNMCAKEGFSPKARKEKMKEKSNALKPQSNKF